MICSKCNEKMESLGKLGFRMQYHCPKCGAIYLTSIRKNKEKAKRLK